MNMRTTNTMITNRFMYNMNNNLSRMDYLNNQLASNRKITRLSDDPVGVVTAMEMRTTIHRLKQYDKNIDNATAWNDQVETNVQDMIKAVVSAYESVVYISNDVKTASDKQAMGEKIKQLRDEILDLANSMIGDRYLFGGFNTMEKPFVFDASVGSIGQLLYNGTDLSDATDPAWTDLREQQIKFELGFGPLTMDVSFPGCNVLGIGKNNIFNVLNELYNDLMMEDVRNPAYFRAGEAGYVAPYTIISPIPPGPPYVQANPAYQGEFYPKLNPDWRPEGHPDHQPQTIEIVDPNDPSANDPSVPYADKKKITVQNPLYEPMFLDGQETDGSNTSIDWSAASLDPDWRNNNMVPEYITQEADGPKLATYIPRLQAAQKHLLGIEGEIGGRTNRLEMLKARYADNLIVATERQSLVEDIDEAEVIMQFKMAETVYRSALAVGARIIQPTLMDFLR